MGDVRCYELSLSRLKTYVSAEVFCTPDGYSNVTCTRAIKQQSDRTYYDTTCPDCNGTGWSEDVEVTRTWRGVRS